MSSAAASAAPRRLAERLNPILVKEVRQALRGRYFRVMFWLTLLVATLVGLLMVATAAANSRDAIEDIGQPFFLVMFGCLAAAVHVFVPFSAFLATSAEWDENTHDLLVLSNLRPYQIVSGKLLSALIQGLLYYSTFGPFLVFAYLLNGIDLLSIAAILVGSVVTCIGLSLVGIALASLARVKAVRGMLMAVFGIALTMAWGASLGMATGITMQPQSLRSSQGQSAFLSYVLIVLVIGGLFGVIAAARFAHEEENRSSGLRVLSTALVLAAGVWGAWMHATFGGHEFAWASQVVAALLLVLLWLFFFSERDTLGRRASMLVPRPRGLALLSAPFLPGGGLAVLLFLLQAVLALLVTRLALATGPVSEEDVREGLSEVAVAYGYAFVYLALPSGLASFRVKTLRGRALVRMGTLVSIPILLLGPALLGLLLGIKSWMDMKHPFNPAWVMEQLTQDMPSDEALITLLGLGLAALVTLALNYPRMRAGVLEVLAASRTRRERGA
ncbi:MAG: hypothetical protein EXS08_08750 [Planctomycetes bacterium]|nr:hypothetical protein [Planctomycetota bacterium]